MVRTRRSRSIFIFVTLYSTSPYECWPLFLMDAILKTEENGKEDKEVMVVGCNVE